MPKRMIWMGFPRARVALSGLPRRPPEFCPPRRPRQAQRPAPRWELDLVSG